jgi:hypothetical protein
MIGATRLPTVRLVAAAALILAVGSEVRAQDVDLGKLYKDGIPFEEFLENASRRREAWHSHYTNGTPTHQAVQNAKGLNAEVRFLVVAEDWCGDSVNTVPYLARLVEKVPGWEMRVINSRRGADLMDQHLTPDGRSATPTILLLDADNHLLGAFVERPAILQEWFLRSEGEVERGELYEQKYTWYAEDAGEETLRELTEIARQAVERE